MQSRPLPLLPLLAAAMAAACAAHPKRLLVVGNDEKVTWDDTGKMLLGAPGKDTICFVDVARPAEPAIAATLPLENSVLGPPLNLALTPDEKLALVAVSVRWEQDGAGWKSVPDNRVQVVDLEARPPRVIAAVETGAQPSGLDVNRRGDLALVANRAGKSVSVLAIRGREVRNVGTVPVGEEAAAVVFTPDGKRALVTKFPAGKIAILDVSGEVVTYAGVDVVVGPWPYSVAVAPGGKIALTGDLGAKTGSDGQPDALSVLDLDQSPPAVIARVEVGDGPEGLAISPDGRRAATALLRGSNGDRAAPYHRRTGSVVGLRIDGKRVTRLNAVEVGAVPEGMAFAADGRHVFVANFLDGDLWVLRFDGDTLVDTGKRLKLPGRPASMR